MLSNTLSKTFLLILLIITFCLGILLAKTMGDREVAETSLKNANAILKEKEIKLKKEGDTNEALKSDLSGCQAKLEERNKALGEQAIAAHEEAKESEDRANAAMSGLPDQLEADRSTGQGPTLATRWMKELFK